MAVTDQAGTVAALKERGDRALRGADPAAARSLFASAVALAPGRVDLWMALAACHRAVGELEASLEAVEGALAADPRSFHALLMKGSLLEALGGRASAAQVYGAAVKLAPPAAMLAEPARRALAHAEEVCATYADELAARLRAAVGPDAAGGVVARRIDTFIEALAGRRKIYRQEPARFDYPGLPGIEFYERAEFSWLEALEAQTAAIAEEAKAVWTEGAPELEPYIDYAAGLPVDQWAELNHSLRWSAFHLWRDGARVEANAGKCPKTMAAHALIDSPRVPARSPSAMFSILRPRTRIPPHTGVSNTRLVLHLPLIVPDGCGFRVGGETRQWRPGEAWVFDDTIEHEAWNDSDRPRAILICDVWSPRLSAEERELIARVTAALDDYNGLPANPDEAL